MNLFKNCSLVIVSFPMSKIIHEILTSYSYISVDFLKVIESYILQLFSNCGHIGSYKRICKINYISS